MTRKLPHLDILKKRREQKTFVIPMLEKVIVSAWIILILKLVPKTEIIIILQATFKI